MSVYSPLELFLLASGKDNISMTFFGLERILGFSLPKSAYTFNAWWSNGAHPQANAWLNAGYKVGCVNRKERTVCFSKSGNISKMRQIRTRVLRTAPTVITAPMAVDSTAKTQSIYGYEFRYLQQLMPECDVSGHIVKYYPQNAYDNKKNLPLSCHGNGAFCRFSIKADDWPGVYLWVVDNRIVYIGETESLHRRFNMGYGRISPRNCYVRGRSTNCKMNKVVLSLYGQGKTVSLYFYNTMDYKRVELDLRERISTLYNTK
jgi:hypothetical protein